MSTKTSIKRIVLVAVSALGFGLLSVVPSNAALTITAVSVASPTLNRAATTGTIDITITNTTAQADDAGDTFSAVVLAAPATATNNTVEVGDVFQSGDPGALDDADETTLTLGAANRVAIGGVNTADAGIAAAVNDGDAIVVSTDFRQAEDGATNLNTGDVVEGGLDSNGDADYADAGESVPTGASDDYFNVAGTYTVGVWYDHNGNAVVDAAEIATYKTHSLTVGGTPTSITITPSATTIAAGVDSIVKVYAYDSGSRLTKLTGTEGVRLTASAVTGTATNLLTVEAAAAGDNIDDAVAADWTTAIADDRTYLEVFVNSDAGGSIKVTGQFFGGPALLATSATSGTIVVNAASNATRLALATSGITTNQYKFVAPTLLSAATAQTDTVFVNAATTRSVSFTITGTAGTNINVALGAVTDPSDSLTAGTTSVAIGSSGTGTYTVAPDFVTAATTYTVTVPYAAGNLVYTIDFMAPTVDCHADGCGISTTGIPSGVSKDIKSAGATTAFTLVVKDQFGTAYPFYKVTLTTASTARNASLDKEAITDATGSATVSYTDASTSTTNLTDALTLKVFAPSDLTTNIFDVGNTITLDYSGNLGSLTLAGGSTATSEVKREVVEADDVDDADNAVTTNGRFIDNTLLSSTTGAVSGYATTYTGSAGLLFIADLDNDSNIDDETGLGVFASAASTVTVPNNTQVFVLSTKPGVGTVTVSAGGLTATANVTFTQVANAANARNVAVSAASTSNAGKMVSVSATVTDGHGNTLEGATVTFVRSGGRFVTGASSVNVTTDANGVAAIDVTSDSAATVTVSASLPLGTHAEADDIADTPVTGYAAASGAKSASISFTGTASDEIAETKAAADAATAAANAATAAAKAAQDAAVAAAQAAEAQAKAAADAAKAAQDAAVAAAEKAAADSVAAAKAAQDAAVAKAEEATDASLEAIDAANAATDAANIAAEAADAATVAAEEARDAADAATAAVEALASEVSTMLESLKAQITTLAKTVAKIAKKVRA